MNEGWKCPVCGRGVAPHEKHCDHHGQQITYQPVFVPAPIYQPMPYEPTRTPCDPWEPPPPITCDTLHPPNTCVGGRITPALQH